MPIRRRSPRPRPDALAGARPRPPNEGTVQFQRDAIRARPLARTRGVDAQGGRPRQRPALYGAFDGALGRSRWRVGHPRARPQTVPAMNVAVLGGLGLMGEAAVHDLCRQPGVRTVLVADRLLDRRRTVLARLPNRRKARVLRIDLRDRAKTVRALRGAGAVVNAAWYELNLEAMDVALALGAHYVDLGGLFHMTRRQL